MRGPAKVAVLLALALSCVPPLLSNSAFSHGDAPSTCENRYDADITLMTIDNGTHTFDPVSDPGVEFDAQIDAGYDVEFTLHTANASSQNNTLAGTTWYRLTAFGFGSGVCVDGAGPSQEIPLMLHVDVMAGVPDGYTQNGVEWGSWPDTSQVRYNVVWHNATEQSPAEEPPQDNQTDSEQPSPPATEEETETESNNNDDELEEQEEEDERRRENNPAGMLSPFIFKDGTSSASATEADEGIEELTPAPAPQENVDKLEINGTLASYHFVGARLYVLSGNWSMAMNDTAVFDFGANFTVVRTDGLDRQEYSLDNLTAVNDSDLILAGGTMSLSSALDYHANGTTSKVNATISVAKLNVVKIELDGMSMPIYGVVDKVVQTENGETRVMERQFDMI